MRRKSLMSGSEGGGWKSGIKRSSLASYPTSRTVLNGRERGRPLSFTFLSDCQRVLRRITLQHSYKVYTFQYPLKRVSEYSIGALIKRATKRITRIYVDLISLNQPLFVAK